MRHDAAAGNVRHRPQRNCQTRFIIECRPRKFNATIFPQAIWAEGGYLSANKESHEEWISSRLSGKSAFSGQARHESYLVESDHPTDTFNKTIVTIPLRYDNLTALSQTRDQRDYAADDEQRGG